MINIESTMNWLKSVANINREISFERENVNQSLKRLEELEREKELLGRIINSIENPLYKSIIHKRYVQGKTWTVISEELHYDESHIHRLHKDAVFVVDSIKKTWRS